MLRLSRSSWKSLAKSLWINAVKVWVARFWSRVNIPDGDDKCWLWRAEKNGNGYGVFTVPDTGHEVNAHELAYVLFNGPLPPGMFPRHSCRHRTCCNPKHMYVSSERPDVTRRKGGAPRKLSPGKQMLLHAEYRNGCKQAVLAKKYGVSTSTVSRLLRSIDA